MKIFFLKNLPYLYWTVITNILSIYLKYVLDDNTIKFFSNILL